MNNSVHQFNQIIQENSTTAEELTVSATQLAAQANQLNESVAFFKTKKDKKTDKEHKPENRVIKTEGLTQESVSKQKLAIIGTGDDF